MKKSFPLSKVYTLLESGPVILLTTAGKNWPDTMPMAWHTMMDFDPPLIGCVLGEGNYTWSLLLKSKECVINIPTSDLAEKVVGCGSATGAKINKFAEFGLTAKPAKLVKAPLIDECYASIECKLVDARMAKKYGFLVLQAVKAWADPAVKNPRTIHHRGGPVFMEAGRTLTVSSRKK